MNIDIERCTVGAEHYAVRARALHTSLGLNGDFTSWFKAQAKRGGLLEGEDYRGVFMKKNENPLGGRPQVDYVLTLDAAKHIALMSSSPKGRAYRARLIAAERELLLRAFCRNPDELAALQRRLTTAEKAEAESFARASRGASVMSRRRVEKPRLQGEVNALRSQLQLLLQFG
ncbi:Phage anti-repressor protein [Sphaerotilus natans]|uniref:antA/AntB antirepressor family protein n=1 Tax=Sphaerotilus natans TaxID=34103 RepID=UPI00068A7DC3|nr:antA/AntB antirepressor family protein [Sphaerotilus natans]SIS09212.1 Phage anti-repressor protein [Sphaerotilus natans]